MTYTAGQKVRASDLNAIGSRVRYERQSGTQNITTSLDTLVQFPTAVKSHADVTPSGTSNTTFTFASGSGVWMVSAAVRHSSNTPTAELSLLVAGVHASGGSGNFTVNAGATTIDATAGAVAVTVNLWQASGGTTTINNFNGITHFEATRISK